MQPEKTDLTVSFLLPLSSLEMLPSAELANIDTDIAENILGTLSSLIAVLFSPSPKKTQHLN